MNNSSAAEYVGDCHKCGYAVFQWITHYCPSAPKMLRIIYSNGVFRELHDHLNEDGIDEKCFYKQVMKTRLFND
jgi:hypothetical protein